MTTRPMSASAPSRRAVLASTSAVQAMIGASRLTAASPVSMPTFSAPNTPHSAKNFSLTNALIGAVYQLRRPSARAAYCAPVATSDLPEPVGVARTTLAPLTTSISASSWCGDSTVPPASAQAAKEVNSSSGSAPRARRAERSPGSSRRAGAVREEDIVRNSVPDAPDLPAATGAGHVRSGHHDPVTVTPEPHPSERVEKAGEQQVNGR